MRITVHLDAFDCADPATYAILWLDKDTRKWSREGHAGMNLPEWGALEYADGSTRIMSAGHPHPLCVLDGLDLGSAAGPFEGETGDVHWYRHAHHATVHGQWHVQWVDETESHPEQGVFADDEA